MEDVFQHFRNLPVTRSEEKAFLELFDKTLRQITEGRISEQDILDGIESAIDNFKNGPSNACAIENFKTYKDLCGSFYYFSPLSAGVARNKTMTALRNCEEFRSCLHRPSLKMVSVGGGTGSDLVGFYSAIFEDSEFRDMEVTIVDNNSYLQPFFREVEKLLGEGDFGNASRFIKSKRIAASFICSDLTNRSSTQRTKAMENAHIVWMKGFISILKNNAERQVATENIIAAMTPGALLVVIDSLAYDNFEVFSDSLKRIFSRNVGDKYILEEFPDHEYRYRYAKASNQEIIVFKRI